MSEKMQKQRRLFGKWKGRVLEIVREKALRCPPSLSPFAVTLSPSPSANIGMVRRKSKARSRQGQRRLI